MGNPNKEPMEPSMTYDSVLKILNSQDPLGFAPNQDYQNEARIIFLQPKHVSRKTLSSFRSPLQIPQTGGSYS